MDRVTWHLLSPNLFATCLGGWLHILKFSRYTWLISVTVFIIHYKQNNNIRLWRICYAHTNEPLKIQLFVFTKKSLIYKFKKQQTTSTISPKRIYKVFSIIKTLYWFFFFFIMQTLTSNARLKAWRLFDLRDHESCTNYQLFLSSCKVHIISFTNQKSITHFKCLSIA